MSLAQSALGEKALSEMKEAGFAYVSQTELDALTEHAKLLVDRDTFTSGHIMVYEVRRGAWCLLGPGTGV